MREVLVRNLRRLASLTLFIFFAATGCHSRPMGDPPASLAAEHDALERERQRVMRELATLEAELAAREGNPASTPPPISPPPRQGRPTPANRIQHVWFYDLNTGELFAAQAGTVAPIDAPSGPRRGGADGQAGEKAGVRAYVFTCGDCGEASGRFIAYLETYTPNTARRLAEARRTTNEQRESIDFLRLAAEIRKGRLVRRIEDKEWVPASSDEGAKIITSVARRCAEGEHPRPCFPTE